MSSRPKISRRKIVIALVDMLEKGESVDRVAKILAAYLVESNQTRSAELYLRDIEFSLAQRFGIVTAYVHSARQLNRKTEEQIEQLLKTTTNAKEIEMIKIENPSLIGGVVIRTVDAELDGSVRTKLQKLRSI